MDLMITAEEPFAPVISSPMNAKSPPSRHHVPRSPGPFSAFSPLIPDPAPGRVSELKFHLIVHDPSVDSSLTHPWDLPQELFCIPTETAKVNLVNLIRDRLPIPSASLAKTKSNGGGGSSNKAAGSDTIRRSRNIRRQKLISATLLWTFNGMVLPMGNNEDEWHYRNLVTRVDLLAQTEDQWLLLKEMMLASGTAKCYIAIRGEAPPSKKSAAWWFGGGA